MFLISLMPTYGRPQLVENTLKCFLDQSHPDKHLIIFDDAGQIPEQSGENWTCLSTKNRCSNLAEKYDVILDWADKHLPHWEGCCVWDDDDLYLPWHMSTASAILEDHSWSHPEHVWTTYPGHLIKENASGRFHGSLSVRREYLEKVDRWIHTDRADFDQQFIWRLAEHCKPGDPNTIRIPSYVFRWGDTGHPHCQAMMKSPDYKGWWKDYADLHKLQVWGDLHPDYDPAALHTIEEILAIEGSSHSSGGVVDSLLDSFSVMD